MTREEAIDYNKNLRMYMRLTDKNQPCKFLEENYIALDMAIKALEQEPTHYPPCIDCNKKMDEIKRAYDKLKEQEPCEDEGIAVKSIATAFQFGMALGFAKKYDEMDKVMEEVKKAVTPQPKTGHWVSDAIQGEIDGQIVKGFICSECGAISVFRMTGGKIVNGDLCPNCGTIMIESQESEVQGADSN